MAQDSFTRIHGNGCGSSGFIRKTNARGRLTIPMSPSVEATPILATAQKSATISAAQRSTASQAGRWPGARARCLLERGAQRFHQAEQRRRLVANLMDERRGDTEADHPFPRDADDAGGVLAAAGQPGPGPADRTAEPRCR